MQLMNSQGPINEKWDVETSHVPRLTVYEENLKFFIGVDK